MMGQFTKDFIMMGRELYSGWEAIKMGLSIMESGKMMGGMVGEYIKIDQPDISMQESGRRTENGDTGEKAHSDGFMKVITSQTKSKDSEYGYRMDWDGK